MNKIQILQQYKWLPEDVNKVLKESAKSFRDTGTYPCKDLI